MPLRAKVLTISDSVARGEVEDRSGPALAEALQAAGFDVVEQAGTPDGIEAVSSMLRTLVADFAGLVITTGGTGFGPRDVTPEATALVVERVAPGLAEAMRAVSPKGRLSRGVAGAVGKCLVLNTPGSASGAVENLQAVVDVLPHALALLAGENPHAHGG